MLENRWNKTDNKIESFALMDDPVKMHVIKTGFKDQYFVVDENGWEDEFHGKCTILTKAEIEMAYNIKLSI